MIQQAPSGNLVVPLLASAMSSVLKPTCAGAALGFDSVVLKRTCGGAALSLDFIILFDDL